MVVPAQPDRQATTDRQPIPQRIADALLHLAPEGGSFNGPPEFALWLRQYPQDG